MAGGGPHQPAAVMVDDNHQVLVGAAAGDLIDPEPHQPARASSTTRAAIAPTLHHAIRINSTTADFDWGAALLE